ncbi:MAG: hypothetical protein CMF11_07655 [Idiomarina sp.]|nr:hypothetical protein [Idiomarina sp.]
MPKDLKDKYVLPITRLEQLRELIFSSSDALKIREYIKEVLDFYPLLNWTSKDSSSYWRARKCEEKIGYPKLRDLWHPSGDDVRDGRLNEANSPILYLSRERFGALSEIGAECGDIIQVAEYKQLPDEPLLTSIVGEKIHMTRWGRSRIDDAAGEGLKKILSQMKREVGYSYVYTDALIAEILSDPHAKQNDYLRSRVAASLIFEDDINVEALVYPGIESLGAFNLAVKPDAAARVMRMEGHHVMEITKKYQYGLYDFKIIAFAKGVYSDGTVDWG